MNCLVQQSLPETTDEEYSPYREDFHSVEDSHVTGFRKRSKSIFNHDSNEKKKATNNSNFPFLVFFFSFSA